MVIVSHDLEVADYCSRVAILNYGRLAGFGKPKALVESLPSGGRMMITRFKDLDVRHDMKRILSIPTVKNVLHAGRNKLKIFSDDLDHVQQILDGIKALGLEMISFTIDSGTFLEYFRLVGASLEVRS